MFAVTVTLDLAPGQRAAFLPLMRANAQASLSDEPGCRQFDICTDTTRPDTVFLYEVYDTKAAFDAHLATAHYASFDAATQEMIAAKTVHTFDEVLQ